MLSVSVACVLFLPIYLLCGLVAGRMALVSMPLSIDKGLIFLIMASYTRYCCCSNRDTFYFLKEWVVEVFQLHFKHHFKQIFLQLSVV